MPLTLDISRRKPKRKYDSPTPDPSRKRKREEPSPEKHQSRRGPTHKKPHQKTDPLVLIPPSIPAPSRSHFEPSLLSKIPEVITSSLAKGTIANYQSAVSTFLNFCDNQGIHQALRFPTDEFVLCLFASSLARKISGSYAQSLFSGLKAWHIIHNLSWRGSPRLQMIIRGVERLTPESSRREPRLPVTVEMLEILYHNLDRSSPRDTAIFAAALVAFWGQCRLGELLGTARRTHDELRFPSRKSLGQPTSANGSRLLQLPCTKRDQAKGELIVITRQAEKVDPIAALAHHLSFLPQANPSDHLFSFQVPGKDIIHNLTKEVFISRINTIWASHGFRRLTGHSFRIGGTSALLKAGIAPEIVRSMGRWSSDAHFRYWRDVAEIATSHAENVHLHQPTTVPTTTSARKHRGSRSGNTQANARSSRS